MRSYFRSVVVENVQSYRKGNDNLPNFLHKIQLTMLNLLTVASLEIDRHKSTHCECRILMEDCRT